MNKLIALKKLIFGPSYQDCDSAKEEFSKIQKGGCLLNCNSTDFVNSCKTMNVPKCFVENLDRQCLEDYREQEFKKAQIRGKTKITSSYMSYLQSKRLEDLPEQLSQSQEREECPICLEGVPLERLSCGHKMHKKCLIETTKALGFSQATCPICRKVLDLSEVKIPQRDQDRIIRDSEFRNYRNDEALGYITQQQRIQRELEYLEYERQSKEIRNNTRLTSLQKDEQIQQLYSMMLVNRQNRERTNDHQEEDYQAEIHTQEPAEPMEYAPPYSSLPEDWLPDNQLQLDDLQGVDLPPPLVIREEDLPIEDWILTFSNRNVIPSSNITNRFKRLGRNTAMPFVEQALTSQFMNVINFTDLYFIGCLMYPFLLEDLDDMRISELISLTTLINIMELYITHPIDYRYNMYTSEQLWNAIVLVGLVILYCANKLDNKREELISVFDRLIEHVRTIESSEVKFNESIDLLVEGARKMEDEELIQLVIDKK